jgi:hypothetical protein
MRPPLPFFLAAALVFLAAAWFYTKRAAGAGASRNPHGLTATLPGGVHPAAPTSVATQAQLAPPPSRPARATGALINRVEQKLLATANPELLADLSAWSDDLVVAAMKRVAGLSDEESAQVSAHLATIRLQLQRNALRVDLQPAERIAVLAEVNRTSDAWLREKVGEERFSQYDSWRKARQRADAESAASQGLNRISRAVPLRPEQKDALYTGFVNAAQSQEAALTDPINQFQVSSSISEEPSRPQIEEEAKAILTPEQWAQYEEQARISSDGQNKMNEHLMSLFPVLISSLQELMEEGNSVEKTK